MVEGHEIAARLDPGLQARQGGLECGAGAQGKDADEDGVEPGEVCALQIRVGERLDGNSELCEVLRCPVRAAVDMGDARVFGKRDVQGANPHRRRPRGVHRPDMRVGDGGRGEGRRAVDGDREGGRGRARGRAAVSTVRRLQACRQGRASAIAGGSAREGTPRLTTAVDRFVSAVLDAELHRAPAACLADAQRDSVGDALDAQRRRDQGRCAWSTGAPSVFVVGVRDPRCRQGAFDQPDCAGHAVHMLAEPRRCRRGAGAPAPARRSTGTRAEYAANASSMATCASRSERVSVCKVRERLRQSFENSSVLRSGAPARDALR